MPAGFITDDDFVGVEAFSGASCFGNALVDIMQTRGRRAYILTMDNQAEAVLRARYPELDQRIHQGDIIFFQIDLHQFRSETLPILLRSLLGIEPERVNWFHCGLDCATYSYVSLSNTGYRTVEGAALTVKAVCADRMLASMFKAADQFIRVNPAILITFESPDHGSFRSNRQVQEKLLEDGWWLLRTDYCAAAMESLDGVVTVTTDRRLDAFGLDGGVWPRKTTVMLTYGLGDLGCTEDLLPRCNPATCRMMVPNTQLHARVLCSNSESLEPGQLRVDRLSKSFTPKGLFFRMLEAYEQWQSKADGYSSWCAKCGEGGDDLLICDRAGCGRVQHRTCPHLDIDTLGSAKWFCDICVLRRDVENDNNQLQIQN